MSSKYEEAHKHNVNSSQCNIDIVGISRGKNVGKYNHVLIFAQIFDNNVNNNELFKYNY